MSKPRHFYTIITSCTSFGGGTIADIYSISEGTVFKADSSCCPKGPQGVSVISFYGNPLETLIKFEELRNTHEDIAVYQITPIGTALEYQNSEFKGVYKDMYAAQGIKIIKYIKLETLVDRFKRLYGEYEFNKQYMETMLRKFPNSVMLRVLYNWAVAQKAHVKATEYNHRKSKDWRYKKEYR